MREVDEELRKTKEQLRAERSKWEEERAGLKQVRVCVCVHMFMVIGCRKGNVFANQATLYTL